MSKKFFYIDLENLEKVHKMLLDRDVNHHDIVLNSRNGFSDIVRYNQKYDTAVFLTVRDEDVR